jgi:putative SOS response-associated peptidase YedK
VQCLVFPAIGVCDIDPSTGLSVPDEDDDGGPVEFRIGEKTFRNPFESRKLFVVDDSFETELRNRSKRNLVSMLKPFWLRQKKLECLSMAIISSQWWIS